MRRDDLSYQTPLIRTPPTPRDDLSSCRPELTLNEHVRLDDRSSRRMARRAAQPSPLNDVHVSNDQASRQQRATKPAGVVGAAFASRAPAATAHTLASHRCGAASAAL